MVEIKKKSLTTDEKGSGSVDELEVFWARNSSPSGFLNYFLTAG